MLALGMAGGLIVTLIWAPIISSWGGGNLSDALTLLGAVSVLIAIGAIACVLPAWREHWIQCRCCAPNSDQLAADPVWPGGRYWLHSLGAVIRPSDLHFPNSGLSCAICAVRLNLGLKKVWTSQEAKFNDHHERVMAN